MDFLAIIRLLLCTAITGTDHRHNRVLEICVQIVLPIFGGLITMYTAIMNICAPLLLKKRKEKQDGKYFVSRDVRKQCCYIL